MNHAQETDSQGKSFNTGIVNGHEYVDLGLSVKWATCNVGAKSPLDSGLFFSWGETQPKTEFGWKSYKFYEGGEREDMTFKKYNMLPDPVDGIVKTRLDLCDDAARAQWGGTWRMPTIRELNELKDGCEWRFCRTENRLEYYKVISMVNGAMILIPLAGFWLDERFLGRVGCLWSASLLMSDPLPGQEGFIGDNVWFSSFRPDDLRYAVCLDFGYSDIFESDMIGRQSYFKSYGIPVRPVIEIVDR